MSEVRRTFVVTVFEAGRVAVVEDVQTGSHARVDDLARVGDQIEAWVLSPARRTSPPTPAPGSGPSR
jgi:hypothetical protein